MESSEASMGYNLLELPLELRHAIYEYVPQSISRPRLPSRPNKPIQPKLRRFLPSRIRELIYTYSSLATIYDGGAWRPRSDSLYGMFNSISPLRLKLDLQQSSSPPYQYMSRSRKFRSPTHHDVQSTGWLHLCHVSKTIRAEVINYLVKDFGLAVHTSRLVPLPLLPPLADDILSAVRSMEINSIYCDARRDRHGKPRLLVDAKTAAWLKVLIDKMVLKMPRLNQLRMVLRYSPIGWNGELVVELEEVGLHRIRASLIASVEDIEKLETRRRNRFESAIAEVGSTMGTA